MADSSKIEWTDATWNIITGCSIKSPGCKHCYAMLLAGTRLSSHPSRAGLTHVVNGHHVWTGEVRFNEQWLDQPLRWQRPRSIFVCAHGDLFHEDVPDEWLDRVFAVMALSRQHRFQVLTKRADRMRAYFADRSWQARVLAAAERTKPSSLWNGNYFQAEYDLDDFGCLRNVWLGVSVERQIEADERISHLLATPAAVRWLSCEPLLGPVDLRHIAERDEEGSEWTFDALSTGCNYERWDGEYWMHGDGPLRETAIDWVVVGGESGPDSRPMHPDWLIGLRDQCDNAKVPFFFKQWGEYLPVRVDHLTSAGIDFRKVGKKAAGRRLHGVEHNGMPA